VKANKSISISRLRLGKLSGTTYMVLAAALWLACILLLSDIQWQIRVTTATMISAVFLWVLSSFSLSFVSFMAVVVMVLTRAIPLQLGLGGFATGSVFLIIAGLMLAEAINETDFARRTAYFVLSRFGGTPGGALAGIFAILLILAFAVPSAAVRITLLLPTVKAIIEKAGDKGNKRNITRLFIIGLAFGATVTGSGILPAALANVITVDLLTEITGVRILYTEWFIYVFPVSMVLLPILWFILMRVFPPGMEAFPGGAEEFKNKLLQMGPLGPKEIKCLVILGITMVLWLTEGLHGMHTAVPAMLAVILFSMPKIGYMNWEQMLRINWSTIILVGFTLSLGTILNETGTANFLASLVFNSYSFKEMPLSPVFAVFLVSLFTQVLHIFLGNVTTVLVTLIPFIAQVALKVGVDPLLLGVVTGVSGLFGFLLPVETIANIVVYGTGLLRPFDMVKPGIFITLASILVLTLAGHFWWPLVGLV